MLIDAHCHCRPASDDITVLYNSVTAEDWDKIPAGAPDVIPFYGIHPWYAKSCSKNELLSLGQFIRQKHTALSQAQSGRGMWFGIGETGLDKTDRNPDFEDQKAFFAFHLWIAQQYRVPVAVHCVQAWGSFMEILSEVSDDIPLLMHSYSGSLETARTLLKRNTWFSFSPAVERIEKQQKVLEQLPLERIFLESDFTGEPGAEYRESLIKLYAYAAGIKGISIQQLEKVLENNLKTFFST